MSRKITVWENDMVEEIDQKALDFISERYKGYEVSQLSALSHRGEQDIFDSLRDSYSIIIQPNMLESDQVQQLAKLISHPIHLNYHSNIRNWDIQNFTFISNDPWETLNEVKSALSNVKDSHGELCLMKILGSCTVDFYSFDTSIYYELVSDGYFQTKIIRHK